MTASGPLRQKAVKGGAYLAVRQILGSIARAAGLLLLTRLLGPTEFGRYAGPLAITSVASALARLGVEVYLIRQPAEPPKHVEDQAFTLLLLSTTIATAIVFGSSWLVSGWVGDPKLAVVVRVMAVVIPINVLWVPAQARLERGFRYRALAGIELIGDVMLYAVSLVWAVFSPTVWAAVAGYASWQAWLLISSYVIARYRPKLVWRRDDLRDMLGYGLTYAPTSWCYRLQELINPLIVGRYLGSSGVGKTALVLRLVDNLSLIVTATARLAHVAMARIQHDMERLRRAHRETMLVQTIGSVVPLAAFALVGDVIVRVFFGRRWEDVIVIFPLVAFATSVDTLFNVHAWVLSITRRNLPVLRARVVELVLFVATALIVIPHLGLIGFGIAGVVSLASHVLIDRSIRVLFVPDYRPSLPWLLAAMPALAAPWTPGWCHPILGLPLLAMLLRRSTRQLFAELLATARSGGVLVGAADAEPDPRDEALPAT
jgi:PST family polysaccharide transporter